MYVALFGLVNTGLAILAGWGLMSYCGVPWQAVNLSGLFLLMGVGMDDTFIILSAWSRQVNSRNLTGFLEKLLSVYGFSFPNL